jgi:iron(III) transport system ATP-binding protein
MGEANVVDAEVSPGEGDLATLRFGDVTISTPLSRPASGRMSLAVRPEAITLSSPGGAGLAGTVRRAVFVGNHMEYEVETPAGELFLIGPAAGQVFAAKDAVTVAFARAIPLG